MADDGVKSCVECLKKTEESPEEGITDCYEPVVVRHEWNILLANKLQEQHAIGTLAMALAKGDNDLAQGCCGSLSDEALEKFLLEFSYPLLQTDGNGRLFFGYLFTAMGVERFSSMMASVIGVYVKNGTYRLVLKYIAQVLDTFVTYEDFLERLLDELEARSFDEHVIATVQLDLVNHRSMDRMDLMDIT